MLKSFKHPLIFLFGGSLYSLIEIIFRGYTHWTMTILGGIIFIVLYNHFDTHPRESIIRKCLFGGLVITLLEFITGCIVNLWLEWDIWDYSDCGPNILGQICLYFSFLWCFATIPAFYICRFIKNMFIPYRLNEI